MTGLLYYQRSVIITRNAIVGISFPFLFFHFPLPPLSALAFLLQSFRFMKTNPKIQYFEDLIVWQKSMVLAEEVYKVTRQGEFAKDWGLRNQIQRAVVSIPSNIAEGFERYSAQELRYFLNIAKGSAGEVRTQLILAHNLGYLQPPQVKILLKQCLEVSRMLAAYKRKVNREK